jgi:glycosyltransferase involved in cell wall biosynthesis
VRVLIDYRSALRARSGVGEYGHQLAAALIASRHSTGAAPPVDLTLFSSSWKDRLQTPFDLDGTKAVDRHFPVSLLNLAWHRLGWPPAELLARGSFDVAHSLHPLLMPARRAAQVVTIHDLNFLAHPERTRAEIRRDYPPLVGAHARRADAILVPSRYTQGEVERLLGAAPDRITICPPGAPPWTSRTSAPRDGYVLFFGTLEPRKNVGTLLVAYQRLLGKRPMPDLVLAGQATEESRGWLEMIERPPLAGHVRHLGYVDPSNRRELYMGARLLVLPSFDEGFGMPVLEAMTIGVPVIAARRGALPEVLGGSGLLIDPDEAGDLANGLERMIDDGVFAAACATAGVARSRDFQWSETAVRVLDMYRQAIERRAHADRN